MTPPKSEIWKFPLTDVISTLSIPTGAVLRHFDMQHGTNACVWAQVDPDAPKESRFFRIVGTGHPIPEPDKHVYVGTALQQQGRFVWHLFEVTR